MTKIDVDTQYALDVTEAIISTMRQLVAEERKTKGELFALELELSILASLVMNMVSDSFRIKEVQEAKTRSEKLDVAHGSYMELKSSIENAVATAFMVAFQDFYPQVKPVEFSCEIDPIITGNKITLN